MVSIKPIKGGEQIVSIPAISPLCTATLTFFIQWNTYGDLPNAELLRRYGHVDLLPLPSGGDGNPGDVVEIKADLMVSIVSSMPEAVKNDEAKERIDWWLEQGGEE
jgi:SET domain-containing protein 6